MISVTNRQLGRVPNPHLRCKLGWPLPFLFGCSWVVAQDTNACPPRAYIAAMHLFSRCSCRSFELQLLICVTQFLDLSVLVFRGSKPLKFQHSATRIESAQNLSKICSCMGHKSWWTSR